MQASDWVICPKCGKKTHTKLRENTVLNNFPLYCPIVNTIENYKIIFNRSGNAAAFKRTKGSFELH